MQTSSYKSGFTIAILFIGILLRFLVSTRGHNYDYESYLIVVEILDKGENIYLETTRYNYGPAWSYILLLLHNISFKDGTVFRILIVAFLSLVDAGIFHTLTKKIGLGRACLFFLNPISIIITGYHNQFDNLALLTGLLAVLILEKETLQFTTPKKLIGACLIGISLSIKHLLFLFPTWLAMKQTNWKSRMLVFFLPPTLFILSFIPFWNTGEAGILNNVFGYRSWQGEYFYKIFIPKSIQGVVSSRDTWILILLLSSFFFRKKNAFDSFFLYTCVMVATSPAITNQYLAIPVSYGAVYPNPFFIVYTLLGTWHLFKDGDGLHYSSAILASNTTRETVYTILTMILLASFVWEVLGKNLYISIKKQIRIWQISILK